ncbi:MAG: hypothetical protein HKO53_04055 [Gemmatimonadetes bacterium]|nr:hypothetical protein [Gemmatimonadota bacterium]
MGYLILAPLFGIWDLLALLTLKQHYAVLATLVTLYVLKRIRAPRSKLRIPGRVGMEVIRALGALLLLLGFYAAGTILPRPMVGLALEGQSRLSVDFHSHTLHSHDGWALFTAARNRAWHEGGGFDVGYVTDHYTWRGVDNAILNNPTQAGQRTVLLSGAEVRMRRRHVNILGDRTRYAFALDSTWHHLDPDSLAARLARGGPPPTILYTIPGPLDQLVPYTPDVPGGVIGVELNDGAPRGLEQAKEERPLILALADEHDLAVVAGANLHGWGRTVTAWSAMEIPGWRSMSPDELGDAIEDTLHRDRHEAVTVVERRLVYHEGSTWRLVLTLPWVLWDYARMMSFPERLSWGVWMALVLLVRAARGAADPLGATQRGGGGLGSARAI